MFRIEYFEPAARFPGQASSIGRVWRVVARVTSAATADRVLRGTLIDRPNARVRIVRTQDFQPARCIARGRRA